MSQSNRKARKLEVHLQLLGTLFLLQRQIRREGLMSIEKDVENFRESKLIQTIGNYDEANDPVYIFVCDVMRLMLAGYCDANKIKQYMEAYRQTTELNGVQKSMFEVARITLLSTLEGISPTICMEFGRQGIPAKTKPSFQKLEKFVHKVGKASDKHRARKI